MNITNELFFVALIPLTVAGVVAFMVRQLRAPPAVQWVAGVGAGFVAGQFVLASRAGVGRAFQSFIRPPEASAWIPHAVLLAIGIAVLAQYAPRRWQSWTVALAGLLCCAVPARLLAGAMVQRWTMLEKLSHFALWAALFGLVWLLLAVARDGRMPRLRQALLVLAAAGMAIVVTLSGSFSMGRLAGIVAAAIAGTSLASPRGVAGAAGVVAVALGSLIMLGVYYAKLSPTNAALLLAAVVAAGGRFPEFVAEWPTWRQIVLRISACLIPLSIALATSLTR